MNTMHGMVSRRGMLQATAAGALWASVARQRAWGSADRRGDLGIALQLYSIRDDCARDFDQALQEVARMGFKAVEFAGYHSYRDDPQGLRRQLDDLGLQVAGTHIATGLLVGDALPRTIEFHKVLGCKYLIVPGDGRFSQPDGNRELAEIFNRAAEVLKKEGMATGYHNHTREFARDGGTTYWELFAQRTSPDVVLQQDVGWTVTAGQDPVALIRKYPGRSKIIHCKPAVVEGKPGKAFIGQDSVPWVEVIQACKDVGGTQWLTIEQETYPDGKTPRECTAISLAGLKRIMAAM